VSGGSLCGRCGAPILWAVSATSGKPMPLDPYTDPLGNVATRLVAGSLIARVLRKGHSALPDETLRVAHFATCPLWNKARR
jgi:hypothetical protein